MDDLAPANEKGARIIAAAALANEAEMHAVSNRNIIIIFVATSVSTGLALLGKIDVAGKLSFFSAHPYILYAIVISLMLLPFCFPIVLRLHRFAASAALLGFIATALVMQPQLEKLHDIGRGTDQGTCLIVGAHRLLAREWPYDVASMFSHNPMSCGPGWIMLHAPILAVLSYPLTMLIFILGCLGLIAHYAGIERASRFVALNALIPGTWLSLANGNDFLTFAFCVIAIIAAIGSVRGSWRWALSIFIILVSHFRLPFIFLPFFTYLGAPNRPLMLGAIITLLSLAMWMAFYFVYPASFVNDGPMHLLRKFQGLSGQDSWLFVLFALAVCVGLLVALFVFWRFPDNILIYVSVVLWPLSALDLYQKFAMSHSFSESLGHWEGTSWLGAVASISAWFVVRPKKEQCV